MDSKIQPYYYAFHPKSEVIMDEDITEVGFVFLVLETDVSQSVPLLQYNPETGFSFKTESGLFVVLDQALVYSLIKPFLAERIPVTVQKATQILKSFPLEFDHAGNYDVIPEK